MMPPILDAGILVILDHAIEAIGIELTAHPPSLSAGRRAALLELKGDKWRRGSGDPALTPDLVPTPPDDKSAHAAAEQQYEIPQITPLLDIDVGLAFRNTGLFGQVDVDGLIHSGKTGRVVFCDVTGGVVPAGSCAIATGAEGSTLIAIHHSHQSNFFSGRCIGSPHVKVFQNFGTLSGSA